MQSNQSSMNFNIRTQILDKDSPLSATRTTVWLLSYFYKSDRGGIIKQPWETLTSVFFSISKWWTKIQLSFTHLRYIKILLSKTLTFLSLALVLDCTLGARPCCNTTVLCCLCSTGSRAEVVVGDNPAITRAIPLCTCSSLVKGNSCSTSVRAFTPRSVISLSAKHRELIVRFIRNTCERCEILVFYDRYERQYSKRSYNKGLCKLSHNFASSRLVK